MPSIGYATVGSNRLDEAKKFYDALLGSMGATGMFEHPSGGRLYGLGGAPLFGVLGPYNKEPATAGNGTMIAFKFDRQDEVKAFYNKAIELGGSDEGAPGERGPSMFFAYFRDLEGNKLCAYCFG